jgi:hypothetical protein
MWSKLKKTKDKVKLLLQEYPHLRDSDSRLISSFWYMELGESINNIKAVEMLKLYCEGALSCPESIRRCRQKVQEQEPELRGESYYKRTRLNHEVQYHIKQL